MSVHQVGRPYAAPLPCGSSPQLSASTLSSWQLSRAAQKSQLRKSQQPPYSQSGAKPPAIVTHSPDPAYLHRKNSHIQSPFRALAAAPLAAMRRRRAPAALLLSPTPLRQPTNSAQRDAHLIPHSSARAVPRPRFARGGVRVLNPPHGGGFIQRYGRQTG